MTETIEVKERTVTAPNGRSRKQYSARCPRCNQEVDLKPKKVGEKDTVHVFKAHQDRLTYGACPMADRTPDGALERIAEERRRIGLPEVAHA